MNSRNIIKQIIEQLTSTYIYRYHSLPHGIDPIQDISNSLPKYRADIVFDIGANVGQSSKLYLAKFPNSHIYCFEPVSETFFQLQNNLGSSKRIECYKLAFGSAKSRGKMILQVNSDESFLLDQSKVSITSNNVLTESVDIVTLDEFCHAKGINHISYLKVDTEGGDLEVLKGAVSMLTEQRIDLVQVEAGMNPGNNRHVPLELLKGFLESHKYFLFGIYEQVSEEWFCGEPHLRRTNLLFISCQMIEMNRNKSKTC